MYVSVECCPEYVEVIRTVENSQPRQAIRDPDATEVRVSTKLGATLRRLFIEMMMPPRGSTVNDFVYSLYC